MDLITDKNGNELIIEAVHPGALLLEKINERGLLKKVVAKGLDILPNHLSGIFAGKRNISAKLAIKLEKLLQVSAQYWAGLQMTYDLHKTRELEKHT